MSQQIESVKMALQELGINASGEFYYNPDYDLLIAHETSPELTGAARGVDDVQFFAAQLARDQAFQAAPHVWR